MEKAYTARRGSLIWINMDDGDGWKNLRSDPRFQDLLHRIGLPGGNPPDSTSGS